MGPVSHPRWHRGFAASPATAQDWSETQKEIWQDVYITSEVKDLNGEVPPYSGYWTDILMKQGNKWVLIGDAGGQIPVDD